MRKYLLLSMCLSLFPLAAAAQPAAVNDLAAASSAEGRAALTWTSPDPCDGNAAPAGYIVRYATSAIAAGDFDASWVTAAAQNWTAPVSSGSAESRTLSGLTPGATLYFAIKAYDVSGSSAAWGASSPWACIFDSAPVKVAGVNVTGGNATANLSWAANGTVDLQQYVVECSSFSPADGFAAVAAILAPGTTHQEAGLVNGNTYYFRVRADDNAGNRGEYSDVCSTVPWVSVGTPAVTGAAAVSPSAVAWTWSFSANAAGYRVIDSSSGVILSGDLASTTNYFLQQGLSANTSSTVYIQAFNGLITADSAVQKTYTLANPPSGITSAETTSRISLSWSGNGNAPCTRYSVQRSTDSFVHFVNVMALARSTTHQDTGLAEGATYQYRVWALNELSTATVKVEYSTCTARIAPNAPMLGAHVQSGTNDGEITVDWVAAGNDGATVGDMCAAYVIKCATYPVTESNFFTIVSSSTGISISSAIAATVAYPQSEPTRTIPGLFPGTTFYVAIKAVDAAGNYSLLSDTKTAAAFDRTPNAPRSPSATLSLSSPTQIDLAWQAPTLSGFNDTDKYWIYRSTKDFSSYDSSYVTIIATVTHAYYTDAGLTPKTTYYYRFTALDKGDQEDGRFSLVLESPFTSAVYAYTPDKTAPAAVTQIAAAPGTREGEIALSWTSPGDDDALNSIENGKFRIDWSTDSLKSFDRTSYRLDIPTATAPGTMNLYTVTGLAEGTTWYFRLWTADTAGNWSAISAGATSWAQVDVTPPAAVNDLVVTPAWRKITLSWTAPGDNDTSGTLNGAFDIRMSTVAAITDQASWDAVPSGYPYRVNITTSVAASTPVSAVITGLANATTYYFALRSCDERANWSALPSLSVSTAPVNRAPGSFTLSSPVHNSIATTLEPLFTWGASADPDLASGDAVTYTVAYSTDSAFAAPVTTSVSGISGVTYTPYLNYAVCEDKTVYWKVWAVDADGATTLSTDMYAILVNSKNTAPASFALIAPAVGVTTTTATPALSWNPSSDVDPGDSLSYRVDYSRDNFSTYTSSAGLTATRFVPPSSSPLVENATYWWRVWAVDGTTATQCAAPFHFRVNAVAEQPAAFGLTAPAGSLVSSSSTISFFWETTADPDPGDTVTYDFSWSLSQNFASSTTVAGLHTASTTVSGFTENGIYYWQVTAVGSDNQRRQSSESRLFYVDTVKEMPGDFALLDPAYNVTISTTLTPLFSWSKAIDPDPADDVRYIIDLSPSPDFTGLGTTAVDRGTDRYYVPLIGLADQTTYYWRVRAAGYQGNPIPEKVDPWYTYSSTGVFVISMVNNPPESFALTAPANGSNIATKTPTLRWSQAYDSDVSASVRYTVTLSSRSDFAVTLESATGLSGTQYTVAQTLRENCTYFWKVRAIDNKDGVTDCPAQYSFAVPILSVPCAPAGLHSALSSDKLSFTLQWSPVTKNSDASSIDDLAGYRIYRGLSRRTLALYATVSSTACAWTDTDTQGGNLYYRVVAFDSSGIPNEEEDSPIMNSLSDGAFDMVSEDQTFTVTIPAAVSQALLAANNAYNDNLSLRFQRDESAEGDNVVACYALTVVGSNGTALDKFTFDQPLVLKFDYSAGTSAGARLAARAVSYADYGNLNIFWNNGIEYIRLGGAVDGTKQSVTLNSVKSGTYQLRQVAAATTFRVSSIDPPKLFTPGIAPYEKITFYVDNPDGDKVVGKVFTLRGEAAAELRATSDPTAVNVILEWDGETSDSGPAPKGVYIYQIEGSGKILNGTIMVAR